MIDTISQRIKLRPRDIRRIADRRLGVGCDQVLLVEPPGGPDADFRYRIFNADGSESGQCGNGARCFARFVHHRKLTAQERMVVETNSGTLTLTLRETRRGRGRTWARRASSRRISPCAARQGRISTP
jgi:diaminopimelate epimerase